MTGKLFAVRLAAALTASSAALSSAALASEPSYSISCTEGYAGICYELVCDGSGPSGCQFNEYWFIGPYWW